MKSPRLIAIGSLWLALAGAALGAAPVRILFDTDMLTDCDDAGALAVLHTLADRGECEILATVVSVPQFDSVATVAAINQYRGRVDLPLGMVKNSGVKEGSRYVKGIATEFPHKVTSAAEVPDAVTVYREVLEKAADDSVTVVTVGYLTNIRGLLQSPATNGHPSGLDLARKKVRTWVCMGGNFIGSPPKDDLKLGNVNFQRDARAAEYAIPNWPGRIVFAGREVCSVPSGLTIGQDLAKTPQNNPVRRAYELYFNGTAKNRHVADIATVLYAVRGTNDCWNLSEPGRMNLHPDMTFEWQADPQGNQRYLLKKRVDGKPNDRHVEAVLNELLIQGPK